MKIIKSSFKIEDINGPCMLVNIAKAGATCYKNEGKINSLNDAIRFVKMIIKNGHESVLEHEKVTVRVICDRGVTHEIVRHRIASYSQESTRYCDYGKENEGITVIDIRKHLVDEFGEEGGHASDLWLKLMKQCDKTYEEMVNVLGISPQFARSVLPNSLKTEIVMTMNLREWRYFFKLRAENKRAHPQLREITVPMLQAFKKLIPVVFDDIMEGENDSQ